MLLELSVLSYHRLSPRQVAVKRFDTAGGTLGRSEQADWYLPDPERVVSGVHAKINFRQGQFSITDQSTNGLFVNRAVEPLGQGNSHLLRNGDILCMGDYEIQVALVSSLPSAAAAPLAQDDAGISANHTITPAFTAAPNRPADAGLRVSDIAPVAFGDFLSDQVVTGADSSTQRELALDEHFHAPSALIPDDWESAWQPETIAIPTAAVSSAAPAIASTAPASLKPLAASSEACVQAFLTGLGVSAANLQGAQSPQWWEQLGQAFQQSLQGVIAVMRERSEVKSSFRVNQTTFQQRENNPLKFSANIDDAFHNLFNRPGASFMPAKQAIAEAFADISRHESAIIAGAGGAMAGLIAELAPEKLEAADFGGGFVDKVNPAQRQARLWARYKALHRELSIDINNKEKQGVNDDFISAYEAYLRNK